MHGVERRLVAGVGVDRRHEAVVDADGIVQNLGHGRQAVGGAGGGGEQVMFARLVEVVVDPHDDIERALFDRRGHDDFFDPLIEVGLQGFRCLEVAAALEHQRIARRCVEGRQRDAAEFACGAAAMVESSADPCAVVWARVEPRRPVLKILTLPLAYRKTATSCHRSRPRKSSTFVCTV